MRSIPGGGPRETAGESEFRDPATPIFAMSDAGTGVPARRNSPFTPHVNESELAKR
jgi:hypothetical protein